MEEVNEERELVEVEHEDSAGVELANGRTLCFTDGSWAVSDAWSGLGWVVCREGKECLYGLSSVTKTLSLLHAEIHALLWQ
ncbi:unnamed protein product [Cochlearia groenlandica]